MSLDGLEELKARVARVERLVAMLSEKLGIGVDTPDENDVRVSGRARVVETGMPARPPRRMSDFYPVTNASLDAQLREVNDGR